MDNLRCLYLENNEADRTRYSTWIKTDWQHFNPKVPITVEMVTEPAEAATKLGLGKYELFVADIYFEGDARSKEHPEGHPEGLRAMELARSQAPQMAIVALSIGSGGLEQKCRDAGADEYVSKLYISEQPKQHDLGKKILSALAKHNLFPHITPIDRLRPNPDNLELDALLTEIGKETIVSLVDKIAKERSKEITPIFVRPGLSGAAVLRVDCDIEVPDCDPPQRRSWLVKISRSRTSLAAELSKDKSRFPEQLFVEFVTPLVETGEWIALAARFQSQCRTLSEWVRGAHDKSQIEGVFQNLFLAGGLKDVYSELGRRNDDKPINAIFSDGLSLSRRARIRKAVQQFRTLTGKHDPMNWFDEKLVDGVLGEVPRVEDLDVNLCPRGVSRCLSHGDLHGRNILVKQVQTPRAVLIDPANIRNLHWALDLARLTADLAVSVIDEGDLSSEWTEMKAWQKTLKAVIHGEEIPVSGNSGMNTGVFMALNWITGNWPHLYAAKDPQHTPRWEFLLALGSEFLRSTYRDVELPPPKRVLALTAGCEALREAARAFRSTCGDAHGAATKV